MPDEAAVRVEDDFHLLIAVGVIVTPRVNWCTAHVDTATIVPIRVHHAAVAMLLTVDPLGLFYDLILFHASYDAMTYVLFLL